MSTASRVPETWKLTGDDARAMLEHVGRRRLLRDAFMRLRFADGFSHARSMAFVTSLVLVQGLIAVVGFAAVLGDATIARSLVRAIRAAVPGPASRVLTDAVTQAYQTGAASRWLPLLVGTAGALITGATLLGQLERGLNRIYGVEQDRPALQKYGLALLLTVTAGVCAAGAFVLLAFGRQIGDTLGSEARDVWSVLRWLLAIGFIFVAINLFFRRSPRRRQPAWSWLAYGAAISIVLWSAVTLLLGLMFRVSSTFGDTYGPLAGIVALQIWTLLSAVAILYGAAVAAQLEAIRAGEAHVQEPEKLDDPRPDTSDELIVTAIA
jgi:YihY family inner membrane protein